jgi:hypothetical protein
MIIWSGYGILLLPIVIACAVGSMLVTGILANDPDYWRLHGWPFGLSLMLGAIGTWFLGRCLRDRGAQTLIDPKTNQPVVLRRGRSFFFIPLEWWAPLLFIFGIIGCFINRTPEELQRDDAERALRKQLRDTLKHQGKP